MNLHEYQLRGQILDIAAKEEGTTEFPPGTNNVKYNTWFYGREVHDGDKPRASYAWCATFCMWVYAQAGAPIKKGDYLRGFSSVPSIKRKRKAEIVTKNELFGGEWVIFEFNGKPEPDHIGLFEKWEKEGETFWCIEGNTSKTGSQSNGGAVERQLRSIKLVDCFISPNELRSA